MNSIVEAVQYENKRRTDKINWIGDLDDDCEANWHGLRLRAEWMRGGPNDMEAGAVAYWWWAISSIETGIELASSNTHAPHATSGEEARKYAEAAARPWLLVKGYNRHSQLELHNKRNLKFDRG